MELKDCKNRTPEIADIVAIWDALNTLVKAGVMPDVEMDVQHNGPYIDRWFRIGNAEFCITNKNDEKPHLADVVDWWYNNNDDPINTTVSELRKML